MKATPVALEELVERQQQKQ